MGWPNNSGIYLWCSSAVSGSSGFTYHVQVAEHWSVRWPYLISKVQLIGKIWAILDTIVKIHTIESVWSDTKKKKHHRTTLAHFHERLCVESLCVRAPQSKYSIISAKTGISSMNYMRTWYLWREPTQRIRTHVLKRMRIPAIGNVYID